MNRRLQHVLDTLKSIFRRMHVASRRTPRRAWRASICRAARADHGNRRGARRSSSRSRRCTSRIICPASRPRTRPFRTPADRLFRHRLSSRPPLGQRHLALPRDLLRQGHPPLWISRAVLRVCFGRLRGGRADARRRGGWWSPISAPAPPCARSTAGKALAPPWAFTALDGLPMGTRCGQLDPGRRALSDGPRGMTTNEIEDMLYQPTRA